MTQNGGTMGTVDQDGNYEANENFLGEISGHDIAENNGTLVSQDEADNDPNKPREPEPQVDGLLPLLIGTGVSLVTAAATAVAGSSTSNGTGRPASGTSGQVNNPAIF
jgi:hypothetical protein